MRAEQLVLELRELLVRFDENLKAHTLLQGCVPYFLDDASHPAIARARADQAAMVDHITNPAAYAPYYRENHHEKPFEIQYGISAEDAHNHLHRVRYLRSWLQTSTPEKPGPTRQLLDCACNDGWMAKNLEGLVRYTGIDLNPHCIVRAKGRKVAGAKFWVGFAELAGVRQVKDGYDVVVAFELIEHVKDPDAVLAAMVWVCKPGGSLFVSTPLGACTGGDLPNWWFVEPKGHVRAYTPNTFAELLTRHGEVQEIQVSEAQAGQLMVARITVPEEP
jgi:2-polyprenyl-3-methyl-5-hydroxy-6-metoxy-1,4-benzoquinol methylase